MLIVQKKSYLDEKKRGGSAPAAPPPPPLPCIHLWVGAAMNMSNFYSNKLTVPLFSEQIAVPHSHTVSLLTGSIANQSSEKC